MYSSRNAGGPLRALGPPENNEKEHFGPMVLTCAIACFYSDTSLPIGQVSIAVLCTANHCTTVRRKGVPEILGASQFVAQYPHKQNHYQERG
jgi:hypothetical protein